MKVAVHMGTLRGHGSSTVGRALLAEFAQEHDDKQFHVWIPQEWKNENSRTIGSTLKIETFKKGTVGKFFGENFTIRRTLVRNEFSVLFSLCDTSLVCAPIPHLLMIQQPYLAYGPEHRQFSMSKSFALKILLMEKYLHAVLETVSMITVQTCSMKKRLSERWKFPAEAIAVIPSAIEPGLAERVAIEPRVAEPPYVCYVASASPHKNHIVLADMMASLAKRHKDLQCKVTVTQDQAAPLARRAQELRVAERFDFLGPVATQDAYRLMRNAVALVMPSKLESFGIPYYEAMALGCPVVAADMDFAREACGNVGLYANADKGEEFAYFVERLLSSSTYRADIALSAKTRYKKIAITWESVARQYIELLEKLSNNGHS